MSAFAVRGGFWRGVGRLHRVCFLFFYSPKFNTFSPSLLLRAAHPCPWAAQGHRVALFDGPLALVSATTLSAKRRSHVAGSSYEGSTAALVCPNHTTPSSFHTPTPLQQEHARDDGGRGRGQQRAPFSRTRNERCRSWRCFFLPCRGGILAHVLRPGAHSMQPQQPRGCRGKHLWAVDHRGVGQIVWSLPFLRDLYVPPPQPPPPPPSFPTGWGAAALGQLHITKIASLFSS